MRGFMFSAPQTLMQAKTIGRAAFGLALAIVLLRQRTGDHIWNGHGSQPPYPGPIVNDTAAETLRARPQRVSELLEQLAWTWPGERISLGDITQLLGDRGYGILMLVLALPGLLPGISSIAAVPLALVALQLAIGLPRPWLPRVLADRSLSRADFSRMVERALPYLAWIERLLRPRLAMVVGPVGERVMGLACLGLALLLTVPILFNMPLVVPIMLMSLAILERDGVLASVGVVAGCLAVGAVVGIGWVSLQEGLQLAGKYLGM
jgi:hypothetical protein